MSAEISLSLKSLQRRLKQHIVAGQHKWRAFCHLGFEDISHQELCEKLHLDSEAVWLSSRGYLQWSGRLESGWLAHQCLSLRRVQMLVQQTHAYDAQELQQRIKQIPWELYLHPQSIPLIRLRTRQTNITHQETLCAEIQKSIQQHLESWKPFAPDLPKLNEEDQVLYLEINREQLSIWLDSSGRVLSKRGYGKFVEEAPLEDTLASAMLQTFFLLYPPSCAGIALVDPLAGSGTFSLETTLLQIPPSRRKRAFAFEAWPSFKASHYQYLLKQSPQANLNIQHLYLNDQNNKCVQTITHNIQALQAWESDLPPYSLTCCNALKTPEISSPLQTHLILNPPYGKRIFQDSQSWLELKNTLLTQYPGIPVCAIFPADLPSDLLGFTPTHRIRTRHGSLSVQVIYGVTPITKK